MHTVTCEYCDALRALEGSCLTCGAPAPVVMAFIDPMTGELRYRSRADVQRRRAIRSKQQERER